MRLIDCFIPINKFLYKSFTRNCVSPWFTESGKLAVEGGYNHAQTVKE